MHASHKKQAAQAICASHSYRQRGFTLIEMIIAIGVAAVLAGTASLAISYMNQNNTASNLASGLNQVYNATGAYVTTNYSALINNQPVAGFANPMAPTIPELVAQQFLPPNFSATGYTGGTWRVRVQQTGTCPGASCNLLWQSYLDKAPTENGKPSLVLTADAATKSGVPAGYSTLLNPGTIVGLKAQWNTPNPVGTSPAILLAQGSYNASQFAAYLPRSGALPMTGDLQMTDANGAHNITGANNVSANGTVQAGSVNSNGNVTAGGNVGAIGNVTAGNGAVTLASNGRIATNGMNPNDLPGGWGGGVRTWDVYAGGTIGAGAGGGAQPSAYLNSAGYIGNQNVSIQPNGDLYTNGTITAHSVLSAGQQVNLGSSYGYANPGWGCGPNGAIATNANGSGQILSCQSGAWQSTQGGTDSYTAAWWSQSSTGWVQNTTNSSQLIQASSDYQSRDCSMQGKVDAWGVVAQVRDATTYTAGCNITFMVPPGHSWEVVGSRYGQPYLNILTYVYTM